MARYRAILAYDGSAYCGYQIQPDQPTVQGVIEQVLARILGKQTVVWAAGRTDTGVHATGQVIAFYAEWKHDDASLLRAVNVNLPDDIALQEIVRHEGFHPRFDALSRTYRYHVAICDVRQPLLAKRAWQMQDKLDDIAMQRAAQLVVGQHDFAAFGNPPHGENTIRVVFRSLWYSLAQPFGSMLVYEVEATAFLQHMVRRLVGAQVALGRCQISLDQFEAILTSRNIANAKWLAPPQGLTLVAVRYPPSDASSQEATIAQDRKQ